jgi:AraC family transcriptional regulator of adaptative response / DNA-3-methyladenine glycosylase II
MRGLSDPDIFLATDLGVIKALKAHADFDSEKATPWRSYLTFQLWDKL